MTGKGGGAKEAGPSLCPAALRNQDIFLMTHRMGFSPGVSRGGLLAGQPGKRNSLSSNCESMVVGEGGGCVLILA